MTATDRRRPATWTTIRSTGHLTLARLRRGTATCDLTGTPIAAEFQVAEIVLVRSDLSRDGASYEVIGRWPTG